MCLVASEKKGRTGKTVLTLGGGLPKRRLMKKKRGAARNVLEKGRVEDEEPDRSQESRGF